MYVRINRRRGRLERFYYTSKWAAPLRWYCRQWSQFRRQTIVRRAARTIQLANEEPIDAKSDEAENYERRQQVEGAAYR
jgi:hypothetical protein